MERALTVGSVNYGIYGQNIYESSLEDDKFNSRFKDVYYLKSKSDGFNYSGNAFEVPGVHGVDDAGLKNQSTFAGFDFDKIWQMGENGPELRNVPA